jgi:hypothetical protein
MPDLSGYDLALLGLVAILVIHSLQEPLEVPEPEVPEPEVPEPDPPEGKTDVAPPPEPSDWNQTLADQATAAGLTPLGGDSTRDTSTRILQAVADIGEIQGLAPPPGPSSGGLDQTDVLEDIASGGHGFVSGRGL